MTHPREQRQIGSIRRRDRQGPANRYPRADTGHCRLFLLVIRLEGASRSKNPTLSVTLPPNARRYGWRAASGDAHAKIRRRTVRRRTSSGCRNRPGEPAIRLRPRKDPGGPRRPAVADHARLVGFRAGYGRQAPVPAGEIASLPSRRSSESAFAQRSVTLSEKRSSARVRPRLMAAIGLRASAIALTKR